MVCNVIIDIFIGLDVSSFFEYDWFHSRFHSIFWFIFSDCASQFFRIISQLGKELFTFSIMCLQWTSLNGTVGLKLDLFIHDCRRWWLQHKFYLIT